MLTRARRPLALAVILGLLGGVSALPVAGTAQLFPSAKPEKPAKDKPGAPEKGQPGKGGKAGKQKLMRVDGTVTGVTASPGVPGELYISGRQKGQYQEMAFTLTPMTAYRKGGTTITPADLVPGNVVQIRYAADETTGINTAQFVRVKADEGLDECDSLEPVPAPPPTSGSR